MERWRDGEMEMERERERWRERERERHGEREGEREDEERHGERERERERCRGRTNNSNTMSHVVMLHHYFPQTTSASKYGVVAQADARTKTLLYVTKLGDLDQGIFRQLPLVKKGTFRQRTVSFQKFNLEKWLQALGDLSCQRAL